MKKAQIPENEKERQTALDNYHIVDSLPEQSFDDLTLIASQICQTPIAVISLIDKDRQWFKSKYGLEATETHRDISFCGHAIHTPNQIFEVTDAKNDNRFSDNPLVIGDLDIGFYAGVPLVNKSDLAMGTLCVIDQKAKTLSTKQKEALTALAREVMNRIELRNKNQSLEQHIDRTNNELNDSYSKFYKLYNDSPDMMASVDPVSKRIIECNETLCKKIELEHEVIIGKDIFQLYHSDCHSDVKQAFKEFLDTGSVYNKRLILRTKKNKKVHVSLNVKAIKDKEGNILYSNSIWRDITELVDAEKQLIELNKNLEKKVAKRTLELQLNKERMELAFDGANEGIWDRMDLKKDEEWWSPNFHQLLGYKEGEIEQSFTSFRDNLLHSDEIEMIDKSMVDCIESGIPLDIEHRMKMKNGTYKWFHARANVSKSKKGVPSRMTGSIIDIDKQKKLELEFLKTRRFLQKITEIAPSIIYVFNHRNMSNEYTNKEIGTVLGYSELEIKTMGENLFPNLCHPDDLNKVFEQLTNIQQLVNNESISIEYRMKNKDGKYRWLLSEDTVFERDHDGSVIKHMGTAIDITNLKTNESKLLVQSKKLETQNEDLKQFAYVATHDLKNPILTLEGHFQYLKDQFKTPTEEISESIEFIEDEITNFKTTLKGLTEAIKLREVIIKSEAIDLNELIKQTSSSFKNQIERLNGELRMNLQENEKIKGNPLYVKSILHNLISNAVKYHSEKNNLLILVSTIVEKKYLKLIIKDNGLGIDLELQKNRLFKMFNRFHHHSEGSGMGLYMVKNMVEKLGGSINIESEVNCGTTITVLFRRSK